MAMKPFQHELILRELATIKDRSPFYAKKFADIDMRRNRRTPTS